MALETALLSMITTIKGTLSDFINSIAHLLYIPVMTTNSETVAVLHFVVWTV